MSYTTVSTTDYSSSSSRSSGGGYKPMRPAAACSSTAILLNIYHISFQTLPVIGGQTDDPRYCAGCGGRILDRYFLMTAEKHWHAHCLKCYDCKYHLDNEVTCFVREGNVYCKEDYYR